MNPSLLTHLACSECGQSFSPHEIQRFCPQCSAPLVAHYDLEAGRRHLDREQIAHRSRGLWRWRELLPVFDLRWAFTLGEGDTPTLALPRLGEYMGFPHLYLKDEAINPTGTFKARGQAVALSKVRELGLQKVLVPTAGNAGGAMAAYAARAGLKACVLMPSDTPRANVEEARITGAEVILVTGLISDAAREAAARIEQGWYDISTFKEPYRLEGKKTMGYEIAQSFGWRFPDVIIYPAGGGIGLVGIWKAYLELRTLGWLEKATPPRLVAVQAQGCAPFVRAFRAHADHCEFWEGAQTMASGLRVPKSFGDRLVLRALYDSQGLAIAVSDTEIRDAQRKLASLEGIFASPEGAATVAALPYLRQSGFVHPEEQVLLLNTGSGLKYLP
ncbi:threonine synthase [uncultured Thermanaerothrix sp.]|uniref:threonine synthase n=1 Tax=uncultured Thermanaerothrix sp. TaxID=1195149 RepID=UPI00261EBFBA|nr:threonine synthase [uncultured Thermanaerothrix sp.]